jgi:hypothetical protein
VLAAQRRELGVTAEMLVTKAEQVSVDEACAGWGVAPAPWARDQT